MSSFYYPGNIWHTDFLYLLTILKTFFNGGPGGGRAGGVGVGGSGVGGSGAAEPRGGPGGGAPRRAGGRIGGRAPPFPLVFSAFAFPHVLIVFFGRLFDRLPCTSPSGIIMCFVACSDSFRC